MTERNGEGVPRAMRRRRGWSFRCGECLTRWTRWSVRRAWWRMGFDLDGRRAWLHRPFWRRPDFCPECIHDF